MSSAIGFHPEQDPISADEMSPCLGAGAGPGACAVDVGPGWEVRCLTPVERERLMGWPDDYTRYGVDDKGRTYELKDGPRERLTGNGVVANEAEWIGRRIAAVGQDES